MARNFSSRMQEQGIPFYRFNPQLDEVIPFGEIDLSKLVGMLIKVSALHLTVQCFMLYVNISDKDVCDESVGRGAATAGRTCETASFSGRNE